MKKKYICIIILAFIMLGFILFFSIHKQSDIQILDNAAIKISNQLTQTIQTDLKKKSKIIQPILQHDAMKATQDHNILTLTVHAIGYEKGYPLAFTHIMKIELHDDGTYRYLSNHIVADDHNQIPKYIPGISNKSQKESGCV